MELCASIRENGFDSNKVTVWVRPFSRRNSATIVGIFAPTRLAMKVDIEVV